MNSRTAFLITGALAIAGATACAVDESASTLTTPMPASTFAISVDPASFALTPASGVGVTSCVTFTSTFDLIVRNFGASDLFLEEAMVRLIDGTTLGGPMVPIPSSDLHRRFGTLVIRRGHARVFRFHERFGCGVKAPRSLRIDARLAGVGGGTSFASIEVP